jgi:hypothetical protein
MAKTARPKGKRSAEGQYIPSPYAQLKSPSWRSLSGVAVNVWLELHTRFNGGNNGNVRLSGLMYQTHQPEANIIN